MPGGLVLAWATTSKLKLPLLAVLNGAVGDSRMKVQETPPSMAVPYGSHPSSGVAQSSHGHSRHLGPAKTPGPHCYHEVLGVCARARA